MTSIRNLDGLRVLVIEDPIWASRLIENTLAEIGCETMGIATSVFEVLHQVTTFSYDAVLLDVTVDGEDTFLVAKLLTENGVPFVFAKNYEGECIPDIWRKVPVLQKPIHKHDLEKALCAALMAKRH